MKKKADRKRGEAIEYTEGDLVWVENSNINSDRPAKKLAFKRAGPFPVIKKVGSSAYELKIPKMWKNLHPVINESKLKPYHYPTFAQQQESSLTVIAPSREGAIQEVEKILNSRRRGDSLQYLVKWQGQPIDLGGQTRDHQGGLTAMPGFSQGPPGPTQNPYNSHTWEIIQQSHGDATLGGGNVMIPLA